MVSELVYFVDGKKATAGLNPCSYGRWSQRPTSVMIIQTSHLVLILVLMEDGLRDIPI